MLEDDAGRLPHGQDAVVSREARRGEGVRPEVDSRPTPVHIAEGAPATVVQPRHDGVTCRPEERDAGAGGDLDTRVFIDADAGVQ
jgi:hypothetical protein